MASAAITISPLVRCDAVALSTGAATVVVVRKAVNLDATFLCCRAFLCCLAFVPATRDRGYGRIATVASIAGKEGVPGGAAYGGSKSRRRDRAHPLN